MRKNMDIQKTLKSLAKKISTNFYYLSLLFQLSVSIFWKLKKLKLGKYWTFWKKK